MNTLQHLGRLKRRAVNRAIPERARKAAEALRGTDDLLMEHVTDGDIANLLFMQELNLLVRKCDTCDYWKDVKLFSLSTCDDCLIKEE